MFKLLLLFLVLLCGCTALTADRVFPGLTFAWTKAAQRERESRHTASLAAASYARQQNLMARLAVRDTQPIDLTVVGKAMIESYGSVNAFQAVINCWSDLTQGADIAKVSDIMWVKDQSNRVRDLAWLINFKSEWMPK